MADAYVIYVFILSQGGGARFFITSALSVVLILDPVETTFILQPV